jgi:hypothetical protein
VEHNLFCESVEFCAWCHNPEDREPHFHQCEKLKSHLNEEFKIFIKLLFVMAYQQFTVALKIVIRCVQYGCEADINAS